MANKIDLRFDPEPPKEPYHCDGGHENKKRGIHRLIYSKDMLLGTLCIDCWPTIAAEKFREFVREDLELSEDAVKTAMRQVKSEYERIRGAGTWLVTGEARAIGGEAIRKQRIYVTFGKSAGELLDCVACSRVINRDDEFWFFAIQKSAVGPICRRDDCRKEEEIAQVMNGAAASIDISCDVEEAVKRVIGHYEKRER